MMEAAGASEARFDGNEITAFGKYQLFASLGRGGMADVFLSVARGQMGFNKLAVIKRLRQALAEELAFRTMFLDEARLAARLNHPNIVHTYEVGEQDGVVLHRDGVPGGAVARQGAQGGRAPARGDRSAASAYGSSPTR